MLCGKQISGRAAAATPRPYCPLSPEHTSIWHPPLLQKQQPHSEPGSEAVKLNYLQQAWGSQQRKAALPRQPTAHASVYRSVLSLSCYFRQPQSLTMQAHPLRPSPTKRLAQSLQSSQKAADSSCAGTHKRTTFLLLNLMKSIQHAGRILPSADSCRSLPYSSQFKLQNYHAAQVEGPSAQECRPSHSWCCSITLGRYMKLVRGL